MVNIINLKEYIESASNNNDDNTALADVRCSSCSNSLIHCGNYSITVLEGGYEGLLCQDCLRNHRNVVNAIVITQGNKISYIELPKEKYSKNNLYQRKERKEEPIKVKIRVKKQQHLLQQPEQADSEKESE